MSSRIWTPAELSSEFHAFKGRAWRVVEAQHASSTMKLTDTLHDQQRLEQLLEGTKPSVPAACQGLHFLLAAPFRYRPYPFGSRFRRAGRTEGVFYASERSPTAIAETAFYRTLFYAESPRTPWPQDAATYTCFSVEIATHQAVDLRSPPFDSMRDVWESLDDYSGCQAMEETCRSAGAELLTYKSVRDPDGGANFAILACSAFSKPTYGALETWRIHLGAGGVRAVREFPLMRIEFNRSAFAADKRLADINWER